MKSAEKIRNLQHPNQYGKDSLVKSPIANICFNLLLKDDPQTFSE